MMIRQHRLYCTYVVSALLMMTLAACSGGSSSGGGDPIPTPSGGIEQETPGDTPETPVVTKSWSEPEPIDNTEVQSYAPQIEIDNEGNILAVWVELQTPSVLMYTYYNAASASWSEPAPVYNGNHFTAYVAGTIDNHFPSPVTLAMNGNGEAWVSFRVHNSEQNADQVLLAHFQKSDESFQTPMVMNMAESRNAYYSHVSINTNGNAVAAWIEADGTRSSSNDDIYGVYAAAYDYSAGQWIHKQKLDTGGTERSKSTMQYPVTAIDSADTATVIWSMPETDLSENAVWTRRHELNANWQDDAQRIDDGNGNQLEPRITVDDENDVHAVWIKHSADGAILTYNRRDAGGWLTEQELNTAAQDAYWPSISVNASQNVLIAWFAQEERASPEVRTIKYIQNENTWREPVPIYTAGLQEGSTVFHLHNDNSALGVWRSVNLWYSYYTEASGWQDSDGVPSGRLRNFQDTAVDSNGDVLLIWTTRGTVKDVLISRFE